jgi:hypothetical protein
MPEQLVDNRIRHTQSRQSGCECVATLVNGESRDPRKFQSVVPSSFNAVDVCTRALRVEKDVLGYSICGGVPLLEFGRDKLFHRKSA